MNQPRRAAALFSVLAAAAVLLAATFLFATASLSSLSFASAFYSNSQAEQLARAAVTQFVLEAEQQAVPPPVGLPGAPPAAQPWTVRFETEPVFRDGGQTLGGQVYLHFDPRKPYYSMDNSASEQPAAGWMDRGTANRSVPPYCYHLVLEVRLRGRSTYFDALVQRRWPYAATAKRFLTMRGVPTGSGGALTFQGQSSIEGNVYLLDAEIAFGGEDPEEATASVAPELFRQIYWAHQTVQAGRAPVSVGGGVYRPGPPPALYGLSQGNLLDGRVDFQADQGDVLVESGNSMSDQVRHRVRPNSMLRLADLVQIPLPTGGGLIPGVTPVETCVGMDYPIGAPPVRRTKQVYSLDRDVFLGPEEPTSVSNAEVHATGSSFTLPAAAANHFVQKHIDVNSDGLETVSWTHHQYNTTLHLTDCQLYVNGGLDLSGGATGLVGRNSTLIVNGTLVLNRGSLDAVEQGMVIACRRLVAMCSGEFRGLIVVTESAVLIPPQDGAQGLSITGGIACGGYPVTVKPEPMLSRDGASNALDPGSPGFLQFDGLTLYHTKITYDPRFLKHLNPAGPCQVLSLRKLR
ncbi:MAG: hypothetical protein AB1758_09180 [Candidatus Eremiobacterota bacterium]